MIIHKNTFSKLGLNQNEGRIYIHLLQNGNQSVYKIAKDLQISRSTTYGLVNQMVKAGFLTWIASDKSSKHIDAISPEDLAHLARQKRQEADEIEKSLQLTQDFINSTKNTNFSTDVRYFPGQKGLEQLIWNTLKAKKKEMYGYSAFDRNEHLPDKFIMAHLQEARIRGPRDHVIVNEERKDSIIKYLSDYPLEVRFLPWSELAIAGDIYMYDNIFAISFYKSNTLFGLEIENQEFVDIQMSMFENLWKRAEVVKP